MFMEIVEVIIPQLGYQTFFDIFEFKLLDILFIGNKMIDCVETASAQLPMVAWFFLMDFLQN